MKKQDYAKEIAELVALIAGVDSDISAKLEIAIRSKYAGKRILILAKPFVTIEDVNEGLYCKKPVSTIAKEVGLSRATIYRMLSNKNLKK